MKHLDIIIPCYNEQECVRSIYEEIETVMAAINGWSFNVCYVDDGSRDNTLNEVEKLAAIHSGGQVRLISFSRNFGKEAAIYAGLQSSTGDAVALMDADHQDSPALLAVMLENLTEGYDAVAVRRVDRNGEPLVRSWFANRFYQLMNRFSDVNMEPGARDYRVMTAQMRDAVLLMCERERFSKGLFAWVGFKTKWLEQPNAIRAAGTTKWSFLSLVNYAISGMVAFTTIPLRLSAFIGGGVLFSAFVYLLYRIIRYGIFMSPDEIAVVLLLFLGGVIIALLGIIGEYLARIYGEVKQRPIYIIKTKKGFSGHQTKGN